MISLNPLVIHYTRVSPAPEHQSQQVNITHLAQVFDIPIPDPPSVSTFTASKNGEFVHYEITDRFTFLFGAITKQMNYRSCFRPLYAVENTHTTRTTNDNNTSSIGLETISDPGSGVSLLARWILSVDKQKPGYLVLTETVKVNCNAMLKWYVKAQLQGAHEQLHSEFKRLFVEKMVDEDPSIAPSARIKAKQMQSPNEIGAEPEVTLVGRVNSGNSIKEGMKMRLEIGRTKNEDRNEPSELRS